MFDILKYKTSAANTQLVWLIMSYPPLSLHLNSWEMPDTSCNPISTTIIEAAVTVIVQLKKKKRKYFFSIPAHLGHSPQEIGRIPIKKIIS